MSYSSKNLLPGQIGRTLNAEKLNNINTTNNKNQLIKANNAFIDVI